MKRKLNKTIFSTTVEILKKKTDFYFENSQYLFYARSKPHKTSIGQHKRKLVQTEVDRRRADWSFIFFLFHLSPQFFFSQFFLFNRHSNVASTQLRRLLILSRPYGK